MVAIVGCKKEPAAPGVEAPGAPASTAEQDALWQVAPDGAIIGIVGSPRGVAMLEIDEPSLYQYSYQSDGKTFTAKAVAISTATASRSPTRSTRRPTARCST